MNKFFKIDENDNVAVALCDVEKGYAENGITALDDIPFAHKILLCDLKKGEPVIKYSNAIGYITEDTKKGSHVHEHNLKTNLNSKFEYKFSGGNVYEPKESDITINAYKRNDGKIGIRNEIWIIPTVGCVNSTVRIIEEKAQKINAGRSDGIFAYTHPFGCSQMDEDLDRTGKVLSALIKHPNAGAVLVVSLGCENLNISELKKHLTPYDSNRIRFLNCQESEDEIEEGLEIIEDLLNITKEDKRENVNISSLKIGFKCGGSDALSGITANPLCGKITDKLCNCGTTAVLTEVPEMFGAEHILMRRSKNEEIFKKQVELINSYKGYFSSHGKECYENPSPGNRKGGITTLEEKSLGCIQKGGTSVVNGVWSYSDEVKSNGLNLLWGPGNDIVSTTNLTCAGVNLILFTTGRGTPLGAPVPTVKISSNTNLFENKKNWIDFNAGEILNGKDIETLSDNLFKLIIDISNGKKTKNEINNYKEISIFKDGVIM